MKKIIEDVVKEINRENAVVIVEGINDKRALIKLGINKEKIMTISNHSPNRVVEKLIGLKVDTVINMLDCDKAGEKLYKRIRDRAHGLKFNNKYRMVLFSLAPYKNVESLQKLL